MKFIPLLSKLLENKFSSPEFYQKLKQVPIKAEALRQAQLAMIHNQVRIENQQLHWTGGTIPLPIELQAGNPDLSNPYYWSGFTMIGSPL